MAAATSSHTSLSTTEVHQAAGQKEAAGPGRQQSSVIGKGRDAADNGVGHRAEQPRLGDDGGSEVCTGEGEAGGEKGELGGGIEAGELRGRR
uniref:DUF834 domain-containing protein n=1 Tax=Oryza meridionalis TaxID=40149 RepID=A0A0E0DP99_9ORYZ